MALLLVVAALAGLVPARAEESVDIAPRRLDEIERRYGDEARERVVDWRLLVRDHRKDDEWDKLEAVNDFFNECRFVDDIEHWKKADYWATPMEMLVTGAGDCEDFSIGKYFTLIEMGVPSAKMLITYVKALELNQAHMVLTYYETPDAEPYVLDNLVDDIEPASDRDDLQPIYSFNAEGLWLAKERGRGRSVGGADRLSLWNEMNERMKAERQ
ncbi:MAG: transglutaminase-like cysteine peptidase [Nitrospinae bacterium]|nr:transglutaminase-like cysteine peptidase [Nitrospinota bacterium]